MSFQDRETAPGLIFSGIQGLEIRCLSGSGSLAGRIRLFCQEAKSGKFSQAIGHASHDSGKQSAFCGN